jgi:hypothetical protein
MKIIELTIDEQDEETGVYAISVVEDPAIELDFITLNKTDKKKEAIELAAVKGKKNILMGAILVPNKAIYRVDEETGQEFSVFFSKDTIRKIGETFMKRGHQNDTTEEHLLNLKDNTLVEAWFKEDEVHDKSALYGIEAPVGAWMGSMKVTDDIYKKAQEGQLKGFSIEGDFVDRLHASAMKKKTNTIEELKTILNG